jgi:hypothetical protein
MSEPHPALDEVVDELDAEDETEEEAHAGAGSTRRWVRYVMPVMVEVDCDEVARVVTLPEEIREDRDDLGHFLAYDEQFIRRYDDEQPPTHAFNVARPEWL